MYLHLNVNIIPLIIVYYPNIYINVEFTAFPLKLIRRDYWGKYSRQVAFQVAHLQQNLQQVSEDNFCSSIGVILPPDVVKRTFFKKGGKPLKQAIFFLINSKPVELGNREIFQWLIFCPKIVSPYLLQFLLENGGDLKKATEKIAFIYKRVNILKCISTFCEILCDIIYV